MKSGTLLLGAVLVALLASGYAVNLRSHSRTTDRECGDGVFTAADAAEGKVCCKVYEELYVVPRTHCKPEEGAEIIHESAEEEAEQAEQAEPAEPAAQATCGENEYTAEHEREGKVCCKVDEDEFYIVARDQCKPEHGLEIIPMDIGGGVDEEPATLYVSPSETPGLEHINWDAIRIIPVLSAKAFGAVYQTPRGRGKFFLKATCANAVQIGQVPSAQLLEQCGDNAVATEHEYHFMEKFCTPERCSGDYQSFTKIYGMPVAPSGPFEGKHILVSELVPAGFSDEVTRPRSFAEKMDLATKMLRGVALMHSKNVAHLDMKPDNLRWNPDSEYKVKIFDWDISRDGSTEYPYPRTLGDLRTTDQVIPPATHEDARAERDFDYWQRFDMYGVGCALIDIFVADKGVKSSVDSFAEASELTNMKVWAEAMLNPMDEVFARELVARLLSRANIDRDQKEALIDVLASLIKAGTATRPTATDLLSGFFKPSHDSITEGAARRIQDEADYETNRVEENDKDKLAVKNGAKSIWFDIRNPMGYLERRAPPTAVRTQRASEYPYELPTNRLVVSADGAEFHGDADFGNTEESNENRLKNLFKGTFDDVKSYLWVLDEAGNFIIGSENNKQYREREGLADEDFGGFTVEVDRARNMKHGDLVPVNDGHHRGEARMGGQFRLGTAPDGNKVWIMDNDSSFCYNRNDNIELHWRSLFAAAKLLQERGVDVSSLYLKDTSNIPTEEQMSLPYGPYNAWKDKPRLAKMREGLGPDGRDQF